MYTSSASFSMRIEGGKAELTSLDLEFNGYRNAELLERALTDYREPKTPKENRRVLETDDEFWYYLYENLISRLKRKKRKRYFYSVD